MESIAPMAKILAEANGIDWRVIQGTGDGGTIVEQDILNYLMRVMNGDEEPPATPVDEPPPDWTGEMPAMPSMEMMSQAGIESDITDFVASSSKPAPAAPAPRTVPGTAELTSDLDQDAMDFELEDDMGMDSPAPVAQEPATIKPVVAEAAPAVDAPMHIAEGSPDVDVELAEPMHAETPTPAYEEPVQAAPVQEEVAPAAELPAPEAQPGAGQAAAAAGSFGLGSILSRLYKRKDDQPAPEETAPSTQPSSEVYAAHVPEVTEATPVHEEPVHEAPAAALGEPVTPAAPVADSPASAPLVADQLREEAPAEMAIPEAQPEPVAAAPTPSVPVAAQSMAQRRGVHLRLSVNTDALDQAGSHLGDHLGHAVPAEVLVARAAARSLGTLGLSSVAVAQLGDEVSPRASTSLHGADFRAAVGEYHAGQSGDWADLMVVDAGQLGLDELHLTQDVATLSLGRRDGGVAALTLTGGVSPQAGAAFLQQVSDLLQTPIKLLF